MPTRSKHSSLVVVVTVTTGMSVDTQAKVAPSRSSTCRIPAVCRSWLVPPQLPRACNRDRTRWSRPCRARKELPRQMATTHLTMTAVVPLPVLVEMPVATTAEPASRSTRSLLPVRSFMATTTASAAVVELSATTTTECNRWDRSTSGLLELPHVAVVQRHKQTMSLPSSRRLPVAEVADRPTMSLAPATMAQAAVSLFDSR